LIDNQKFWLKLVCFKGYNLNLASVEFAAYTRRRSCSISGSKSNNAGLSYFWSVGI